MSNVMKGLAVVMVVVLGAAYVGGAFNEKCEWSYSEYQNKRIEVCYVPAEAFINDALNN